MNRQVFIGEIAEKDGTGTIVGELVGGGTTNAKGRVGALTMMSLLHPGRDNRGGPVMMMTLSFTLLQFGQQTDLKLTHGMDVLLSGVRGYMTDFGNVFEGAGVYGWDG